jgi:hypothetical protein
VAGEGRGAEAPSPRPFPVAAAALGVDEPGEHVDGGAGVRVRIERDAALVADATPLAGQKRAAEQNGARPPSDNSATRSAPGGFGSARPDRGTAEAGAVRTSGDLWCVGGFADKRITVRRFASGRWIARL